MDAYCLGTDDPPTLPLEEMASKGYAAVELELARGWMRFDTNGDGYVSVSQGLLDCLHPRRG